MPVCLGILDRTSIEQIADQYGGDIRLYERIDRLKALVDFRVSNFDDGKSCSGKAVGF